ncbi:MAG: hypothetical protein LBU85_03415 [Treponema sp.]|jgi:hypothetical protein|nr:hypothetical protein [Treponema sp.]
MELIIFIIPIILSTILFLVFKIKKCFKIRFLKLNIILSIMFSTLFSIIFIIIAYIRMYNYTIKANEIYKNTYNIIPEDYGRIGSENISYIIAAGIWFFIIYVVILLTILIIIDIILYIHNKKCDIRQTGT